MDDAKAWVWYFAGQGAFVVLKSERASATMSRTIFRDSPYVFLPWLHRWELPS